MEIVCKYWLRHEQVQSAIKKWGKSVVKMCLQEVAGSIPQAKAKIIVFIKKNFCTSAFFKKKEAL